MLRGLLLAALALLTTGVLGLLATAVLTSLAIAVLAVLATATLTVVAETVERDNYGFMVFHPKQDVTSSPIRALVTAEEKYD